MGLDKIPFKHVFKIYCFPKPSEHVNNFHKHISNISKTAFYHLRIISKVKPFLSQSDAEKLVPALFLIDLTTVMRFLLDCQNRS